MSEFLSRIRNYMKLKIRQREGILIFKELLHLVMDFIKMLRLTIIIKTISGNCNIEELVDFASSPKNKIIQLHQFKYEISRLLSIIKEYKAKIILEIGTLNGGTLFLFSRIINKDAILISVDLPKYRFGHFQFDWRVPLIKRFSLPHQQLTLIRANSHMISTLNYVKNLLNGRKLDFLFIDADHSYLGVKTDFEMYSPLVKNGGIIAFHDIVPPSNLLDDVYKFWKQIKNQFEFEEIIVDRNQKVGGIGILKK